MGRAAGSRSRAQSLNDLLRLTETSSLGELNAAVSDFGGEREVDLDISEVQGAITILAGITVEASARRSGRRRLV